jgi:hypothetical protein
MKFLWILIGGIATTVMGCAVLGGGLPKQRPSDLVVTYNNGGGMLNQSEEYYICQDSLVRDSRYQGHQNRWSCKPDPAKLDALYAQFLKDDITSIRSNNEGEVYDRGGITLRFSYGSNNFELVDAGNYFIAKADADRFGRTADGIVHLVEDCIQSQAIAVVIELQLQLGDSVAHHCSLSFDNNAVVDWQAGDHIPLAGPHTVHLLPGRYEIEGSAQVGSKWTSLQWPIEVTAAQRHFRFVLKNDSFEIIHE